MTTTSYLISVCISNATCLPLLLKGGSRARNILISDITVGVAGIRQSFKSCRSLDPFAMLAIGKEEYKHSDNSVKTSVFDVTLIRVRQYAQICKRRRRADPRTHAFKLDTRQLKTSSERDWCKHPACSTCHACCKDVGVGGEAESGSRGKSRQARTGTVGLMRVCAKDRHGNNSSSRGPSWFQQISNTHLIPVSLLGAEFLATLASVGQLLAEGDVSAKALLTISGRERPPAKRSERCRSKADCRSAQREGGACQGR